MKNYSFISIFVPILSCVIWLNSFNAISQPLDISAENFDFADNASREYPESKVSSQLEKIEINFNRDKNSDDDIQIISKCENKIVSLQENINFTDVLHFDDNSSIDYIEVYNEKHRKLYFDSITQIYEDYSIFSNDVKMKMYNVSLEKKGEEAIIKSQKQYNSFKYFVVEYFHQQYPVQEKQIVINVPDWLEIDIVEYNFKNFSIRKNEEYIKKKKTNRITYSLYRLKPIKNEKRSPHNSQSFPHLIFHFKTFKSKRGRTIPLFEKIDNLYGWYSSLLPDNKETCHELDSTIQSLIQGKTNEIDKAKALFYWVQDNIRYIAFEEGILGFQPETAKNVFENKYGDCKGKANLLKYMLQTAGIDARMTWIGTRNLPYDYSIPSIIVDNHMICTAIIGDNKYFLDPTEYFMSIDDYAFRIQGKSVLIEDGKNYILDSVPKFSAKKNIVRKDIELFIDLGKKVIMGKQKTKYTGEEKSKILTYLGQHIQEKRTQLLKDYYSKRIDDCELSEINTSDYKDRDNYFIVDFKYKVKNEVQKFGNSYYISLDQYDEFQNYIIEKERESDINFSNNFVYLTKTTINVPSGFNVKYIPQDIKHKNDNFSILVKIVQKGNKIIYYKKISIENGSLSTQEFEKWNNSINLLTEFYNDRIILSKI